MNSDPVNKKHLINGCHFEYNFVSATYNAQGSALFIRDATDIINSVFVFNSATSEQSLAQGTIFYEGPDLSSGNNNNGTSMNFINNTVANNSVTSPNNNNSAAAIYYCDWVPGQGRNSSTLYAFNNIIYGNKDNGSIDEHQIEAHCGGSVIRADYNNIHNLSKIGEAGNNASAGLNNYDYSLDIDPAFIDGDNNDFSLDNKSLNDRCGNS